MLQATQIATVDASFDKPKFAKDIRAWRAGRKFTSEYVGSLFGVSKATVSRWENEKKIPTVRQFLIYCALVGRSPLDYMTFGDVSYETIEILG